MSDAEHAKYPPIDEFYLRIFRVFDGFCGPSSSNLWWRTNEEWEPLTLFVNCSDLFWWATCDDETLTPDNIDMLEQAVKDIQAITPDDYTKAHILFCCRLRQMRPQTPYYKYIPEALHPLFNACGPEREPGKDS